MTHLLFSSEVMDPTGETGLAPLRKKCLACVKCELNKNRTLVVFGEGNSNKPPIAFIGEAPGDAEDRSGRPFVGNAGKLLDRMIVAMGFAREDVYVLNAVNCRPKDNRTPEKQELEACYEYLLGQLRAVQPKVIVTLGGSATRALLKTTKGITEMRGKWKEWESIPVMPTFHPSFLLRDPTKDSRALTWVDLKQVCGKLGHSIR